MRNLLNFLGYGNPKASVWFIGQEERLAANADVGKQLLIRSLFPSVIDCAIAHAALEISRHHRSNGEPVHVQRTWRAMCHLMLCLSGQELTKANVVEYQVSHLGATAGDTLLTELMPLPRENSRAWPYSELLTEDYSGAKDYDEKVWKAKDSAPSCHCATQAQADCLLWVF